MRRSQLCSHRRHANTCCTGGGGNKQAGYHNAAQLQHLAWTGMQLGGVADPRRHTALGSRHLAGKQPHLQHPGMDGHGARRAADADAQPRKVLGALQVGCMGGRCGGSRFPRCRVCGRTGQAQGVVRALRVVHGSGRWVGEHWTGLTGSRLQPLQPSVARTKSRAADTQPMRASRARRQQPLTSDALPSPTRRAQCANGTYEANALHATQCKASAHSTVAPPAMLFMPLWPPWPPLARKRTAAVARSRSS